MAKLGRTGTTIIWRLEKKERDTDGMENIQRYALRSDGVLLSNYVAEFHGGRHNYGWKIATRKPRERAKEILKARGFVESHQ